MRKACQAIIHRAHRRSLVASTTLHNLIQQNESSSCFVSRRGHSTTTTITEDIGLESSNSTRKPTKRVYLSQRTIKNSNKKDDMNASAQHNRYAQSYANHGGGSHLDPAAPEYVSGSGWERGGGEVPMIARGQQQAQGAQQKHRRRSPRRGISPTRRRGVNSVFAYADAPLEVVSDRFHGSSGGNYRNSNRRGNTGGGGGVCQDLSSWQYMSALNVDPSAQLRVEGYVKHLQRTSAPSSAAPMKIEVQCVPKSTMKRAIFKFSIGTNSVTAMGQSTKSKMAQTLCMMHADKLIDFFSIEGVNPSEAPKPFHEQTALASSSSSTATLPQQPTNSADQDRAQALSRRQIPRTGHPVVDKAADMIEGKNGNKPYPYNTLALQQLNNYMSDAATAMITTKVSSTIHVATLALDGTSALTATGVAANKKDAKRLCASHALCILQVLHDQNNGKGSEKQKQASSPTSATCGSAPIDSILLSLKPQLANLYNFYCTLFPEVATSQKMKFSRTDDNMYECELTISDVTCTGIGINRFEAERSAMESVMGELENLDTRLQDIARFMQAYPSVSPHNLPTAVLPDSLKDRVRSVVDDIKQQVPLLCEQPDGSGAEAVSNLPVSEDASLRSFADGALPPNPALAERMQRRLCEVRANADYLSRYHPRRSTLAIASVREEIAALLQSNRVVTVCGTTGCGKTTQVPQYLLDDEIMAGRGDRCNIIVTQPRRLTTFSVAERIAKERMSTVGEDVGYAMRLDAKPGRHITLCTTGVLLQILAKNPTLSGVSYVVIDEVHERDVNCDVVLALVKQLLQRNTEIKVVLMSATMESRLFSEYFHNAPVVQVDGAVYPVQVHYLEDIAADALGSVAVGGRNFYSSMFDLVAMQNKAGARNRRIGNGLYTPPKTDYQLIAYLVHRSITVDLGGQTEGKSILIFVPGWKEILAAKQAIESFQRASTWGGSSSAESPRLHMILLHSTVDAAQQRECFKPAPKGYVKVVIATNIAESGITIDDAAVVIDTGLIKTTTWVSSSPTSPHLPPSEAQPSFSTQLSLQYASQANGTQRKGRAGRTQGGICYRLLTRLTWDVLPAFQQPEIHRVPLTQVLLKLLSLGYSSPKETLQTFIEPPSAANVEASMAQLKNLDAVNAQEQLTPLGHYLAQLPCDPRVGKLVMMGAVLHCLDSVLTIAATADITPYISSRDLAMQVRRVRHMLARGSQSDQISYLNAYNAYCVTHEDYEFARHNHLHRGNLNLISKYKQQYRDILHRSGLISNAELRSVAGSPTAWSPDQNYEEMDVDCMSSASSFTGRDGSSLFVDTSILSEDALDVSLVKACLCSSLFPNVAVLDSSGASMLAQHKVKSKLTLRTPTHAAITPGSDSACRRLRHLLTANSSGIPTREEFFKDMKVKKESSTEGGADDGPTLPAMFYVYQDVFRVQEANKNFLTTVSSISLWALLLFGASEANVRYFPTLGLCVIGNWITVRIDPDTFRILHDLRHLLHACVWQKYRDPLNAGNNDALDSLRILSRTVLKAPIGNDDNDSASSSSLNRLVDSGLIISPTAARTTMDAQADVYAVDDSEEDEIF